MGVSSKWKRHVATFPAGSLFLHLPGSSLDDFRESLLKLRGFIACQPQGFNRWACLLHRLWVRDQHCWAVPTARRGAQLWAHHRRAGCRDIAGWGEVSGKYHLVISWCDWIHIWMHFLLVFVDSHQNKYCWLNCWRFFLDHTSSRQELYKLLDDMKQGAYV